MVSLIIIFSFNTVFAVKYKGDMNEDNKRDIKDVRLLLQEYVNSRKWSPEELKARDMNNDSIIDLMDVRLLLQSYINQDPLEEIPPEAIAVSGVTLNKTSLSLAVGESATLKATFKPTNATNKKVTWSTSDKTIATVTSGGKVSGVKEGTATITVKTADGNKTATCKVTVKASEIKIAVPTFKDKIFNSKEQSIKAEAGYILSGTTKATNAGTYTAKATLQDGYVWDDNTKTVKEVKWKIVKSDSAIVLEKPGWITSKTGSKFILPLTDMIVKEKENFNLWYDIPGDGKITAKSSDTRIVTLSKSTTGEKYFTVKPIRPGTATITISLSAGTNFKANSIEIKLISEVDNKGVYGYTYSGQWLYGYSDNNIQAWVESIDGCYVTKIWVRDPSRQLKKCETNIGSGLYDSQPFDSMRLMPVQNMVQGVPGAVVACNGSGFNLAGSWEGQKKYGGNWDRTPTGHVIITNGVLRRNRSEVNETEKLLGILDDGTLQLFSGKCSTLYDTLVKAGVVNTIHFDSKLLISDYVPSYDGKTDAAPRTAFGQIDKNNYVIINVNARRIQGEEWKYQTRDQITQLGMKLGCKTLYNCDGGGSSQLWFVGHGTVFHGQSDGVGIRPVSDAILFTN